MVADPEPPWNVLGRAETRLLSKLAGDGVVRIEYVVGFVEPFEVSVWLGTTTDTERDELQKRELLNDEVGRALSDAGIDGSSAVYRGVVVESQETVDREFEGSWFYRLR